MTLPTTFPAIVEAVRNAGATEEMIAAKVKASGESQIHHPNRGGRSASMPMAQRASALIDGVTKPRLRVTKRGTPPGRASTGRGTKRTKPVSSRAN
jgi:hypothetical protein